MGHSRGGKIYIYLGREDVVLVHPQNGFNDLIFNWCIGDYWFIPAIEIVLLTYTNMVQRRKHNVLKGPAHRASTFGLLLNKYRKACGLRSPMDKTR